MSLEIAQFCIYFTSKRPHPEMIKTGNDGISVPIPKYGLSVLSAERHYSSVVTSNLHDLRCFEKISIKVYQRKEKGKLNILLFPVVWVPSKLVI